eukprot:GEMP01017542.1.p1 GENE.GEMP01017542.1~~GEMP01017542.1.p1  ORF type:complete len:558 (+),score=165.01 GEMP01017542.1:148-1821(+)
MDELLASIGDRISRVVSTLAEKEFGDAIKQTLELQRQEWEPERRKLEQQRRDSEVERQKLEDLRHEWDEERGKHETQRRAWEQERELFEDQRANWEAERASLIRRNDEMQRCILVLNDRIERDAARTAIVPFADGDPPPPLCMTAPQSITKVERAPSAPSPRKKQSVIDVTSPEKQKTTTEPITHDKASLPLSVMSCSSISVVDHPAPICPAPCKDTSDSVLAPFTEFAAGLGAQIMTAKDMHRMRLSVSNEVIQRGSSPRMRHRRSGSSNGSASTAKKAKKDHSEHDMQNPQREHNRQQDNPQKHHAVGGPCSPPKRRASKNSPHKVRTPPSVRSRGSSRGKKKSPGKKRVVASPMKQVVVATTGDNSRVKTEVANDKSVAPLKSTRSADGGGGGIIGSANCTKVSPRVPAEIVAKQPKRRDSQAWIVASNFPRSTSKVKTSASRKTSKDTHAPTIQTARSTLLDRITARASNEPQNALVLHQANADGVKDHGGEKVYQVVRGKARAKLAPTACEKCIKFNKMTGQKEVDDSCRHRFNATPPSTPANFWDLTLEQM